MKLLTAVSVLLFLQLPPSPIPTSTKAAIEGVVLRSTTSDPVEGAKLVLMGANAGSRDAPIATVASDADGKFLFSNLDPGSYRISIAAEGYTYQDYGSRGTGLKGQSLPVVAGQTLKGITVRMIPTGNISGHILDSNRRPFGQVQVQLVRPTYNSSGTRTFQVVQAVRSDDRGAYRIYWVTPGRYYVSTQEDPRRRDLGSDFPETYYPGVTDPNAATAVDILSDSEIAADLILSPVKLYRVRGRIVDTESGQAPVRANLSFRYADGQNAPGSISRTYNPVDGSFEIAGIIPGSYVVSAQLPSDNSVDPSVLTS